MQDAKNDERRATSTPSPSVPSAVLARLIEEVTEGVELNAAAYNRTYNRHNR
jgi:hypothetical protein